MTSPAPLDLRPLTIGELLDRSFTIYRRHLLLFVGIMAVPSVFGLAAGLFSNVMTYGQNNPLAHIGENGEPPDLEKLGGYIAVALVGVFAIVAVSSVAYLLALGATTIAVSDLYNGRTTTIGAAYREVRGHIGRLMWLSVLFLVRLGGLTLAMTAVPAGIGWGLGLLFGARRDAVILIGATFAMLGMFTAMAVVSILSLRYAAAVPALILESIPAAEAIRRSVHLTRGYLGRTSLLVLCAMVLTYASLTIFQMPFMVAMVMAGQTTTLGVSLLIAGTVSGSIGSTLTAPIMIIGFAVLYYDLRVRKEALDLQMVMQTLPPTDAPGSLAPPPLRRPVID